MKNIKVLINASSICGGGGLTQTLALLDCLEISTTVKYEVYIRKSLAERVSGKFAVYTCSDNSVLRFIQQMFVGYRRPDVDFVFTVFGIGLGGFRNKIQIINVALPIICYDDSKYWKELSRVVFLRNKLKVLVRRYLIRERGNLILCESQIMRERLVKYARFNKDKLRIVKPVISRVARKLVELETRHNRGLNSSYGESIYFLYVTGNDRHKNLHYLENEILSHEDDLRKLGIKFRVTVNRSEVSDQLEYIGPKHGDDLLTEYLKADVLVNLSDLESISNNFLEALAIKKPMFINSTDFALDSVRVPYVTCDIRSSETFIAGIKKIVRGDFMLPDVVTDLAIEPSQRVRQILSLYEEIEN